MLSRSFVRVSTPVLRAAAPVLSVSSSRTFATLYTGSAHTTGGRNGESASDDGKLKVHLSTPKEMGGPGGEGTNPEQVTCPHILLPHPLRCPPSQLLTNSSPSFSLALRQRLQRLFPGAMGVAAKNLKLKLPKDAAIDSKVSLNKEGEKLGLAVVFNVSGSGDKADLKKIVEEAHKICPYSNATRNNVDVQLNVV